MTARPDQQDSQKGLLSCLTNWPRPARSANVGVQQPLWPGDTGEITTGVTFFSGHQPREAAPKLGLDKWRELVKG